MKKIAFNLTKEKDEFCSCNGWKKLIRMFMDGWTFKKNDYFIAVVGSAASTIITQHDYDNKNKINLFSYKVTEVV